MAGIYLIDKSGALREASEEPYARESDLQRLLAEYPKLLAGDQLDPGEPVRWLLVRREAGIPASDDSGARWAVDHLFLDHHGIPTLVEVKRSSDTRLRREVVGQMLDYAANAVAYWPVAQVRTDFETRCESEGLDPTDLVQDLVGDQGDAEGFWTTVKTNLQAGRVRMVFVADLIPPELRRIVEFLNEQMDPAEVVAVEIRRYEGAGVTVVTPRLLGQTADAQRRKAAGGQTRQWDEPSFFAALEETRGAAETQAARQILAWCEQNGLVIQWSRGNRQGSYSPKLHDSGALHNLFTVWTDGGLVIQLASLKPPFDQEERKEQLITRLNTVPGFNLSSEAFDKWPGRKLTIVIDENNMSAFLRAWEWFIGEVRDAGRASLGGA